MQTKNLPYNLFIGLFLLLLQVFVVRELTLWNVGFCYLYAVIFLAIPISFPTIYALITAFFMGLFIDLFYNTMGINAFASVLLVFLKPTVLKSISTPTHFEDTDLITPHSLGLIKFVLYGAILLFAHHFALFQLQAFSSNFIGNSLFKALVSTFFTLISGVTLSYLLFSTSQRR